MNQEVDKNIDRNKLQDYVEFKMLTYSKKIKDILKIPKNTSNNERSGSIEFVDPKCGMSGASMMSNIFKSKKNCCLVPFEDLMIIFPSFIKHFVYPHYEEEDRISIAFNIGY